MKEWLTDKEKRILFSALIREKEVCIQVDKQCDPREAYEQSLQSVCESLEHKFYYDRLFKQMEKQTRADAIDEFFEKIQSVAFGRRKGIVHLHDIVAIRDKLKEQKNE